MHSVSNCIFLNSIMHHILGRLLRLCGLVPCLGMCILTTNANGELEMNNRRAIVGKIWDKGLLVEHMWGTFDLVVFNIIWGNSLRLRVFPEMQYSKCLFYSFIICFRPNCLQMFSVTVCKSSCIEF